MKYEDKVDRLEDHLKDHPTDYQAVVALLKRRSDMIEHQAWLRMIERKRRVAEVRKERREKRDAKESNVE